MQNINCHYAGSDIFLIGIYDDYYRCLSRILLDVLSDGNLILILFTDIDKSGKIVCDLYRFSTLQSKMLFNK
jgi:hypothetical protein